MNEKIQDSIQKLSNQNSLQHVCRQQAESHPMPSTDVIKEIVKQLRAIIFPGYFGNSDVNLENIDIHIRHHIQTTYELLINQIKSGVCFDNTEIDYNCDHLNKRASDTATDFISQLPEIRKQLYDDAVASYNGDPASKSIGEVIFSYPGIRAISSYRFAHALLKLDVPIIPRIIAELAHSETGIDIHPGAKIGNSFMIDHGTGVVVGETAVIGNDVRIYQGVTLGAKSFPLDKDGNPIKGIDRHPKIEDDVIIYSNSTILGPITIGKGTIIGGNIWVDEDIPPGSRILQRKGKENAEKEKKKKKMKFDRHHRLEAEPGVRYFFDPVTNRPTPPFKVCKGCNSKNGCRKCRKKYEEKYGVKV
jgi:serine O-acetyltransferase